MTTHLSQPPGAAEACPASVPGRTPSRQWIVRGLGEILITLGVLIVMFVGWQLWWTNLDADAAQEEAVTRIAQEFGRSVGTEAPPIRAPAPHGTSRPTDHTARRTGSESDDAVRGERTGDRREAVHAGTGAPPVAEPPGYGQALGIVYVPRFGTDYARPLMEGTGADVLDTLGLGHYTSTAMPGEIGNVAVAGHRQTNGKVLDLIHTLVPGDKIHVRTVEGYYTYVFRSSEIVHPSDTRVLAPVPGSPGTSPSERLLTLTSCHPRFGSTERFIAYAVLESWQPAAEGPPADIAETVAAVESRS